MALSIQNPFATNPMKSGVQQQGQVGFGAKAPGQQGPEAENQMYGNAGKGKLFANFSVPNAQQGNSFLGQGALGTEALYGANDARLGAKLNVIG
jgi:hypothetical protein